MVRGVGREVLEDPGDPRVRGDRIAVDGEWNERAVVVEEQETPTRSAIRSSNLIPVCARETLDLKVLRETDDVVEALQEPSRPSPRIVPPKSILHRAHAGGLLLDGHRQGAADRAHDLVHVVRVHDERLEQLAGGTGHLAQDEDAARLLSRGDILL